VKDAFPNTENIQSTGRTTPRSPAIQAKLAQDKEIN
jgi:hypothetical protein